MDNFEVSLHEMIANSKVEKAVIKETDLNFKDYLLTFEAILYRYDEDFIELEKFIDFYAVNKAGKEVDLSESELNELIEQLQNYDVDWEISA